MHCSLGLALALFVKPELGVCHRMYCTQRHAPEMFMQAGGTPLCGPVPDSMKHDKYGCKCSKDFFQVRGLDLSRSSPSKG